MTFSLADKGWDRAFDDPIPLPDGGKLTTMTIFRTTTIRSLLHYYGRRPHQTDPMCSEPARPNAYGRIRRQMNKIMMAPTMEAISSLQKP